jgi:hypothetical protein
MSGMAGVRRVVRFIAERNPMRDGRLEYRFPAMGISFGSLPEARAYFAKGGFEIERVKATRRNRLFG